MKLLAAAGLGLMISLAPALAADRRDPALWPFAADSPWNTPLGSGAEFAAADAAITRDVVSGGAKIHAGAWGQPVWFATASDPVRRIVDKENKRSFEVHVPADARPDPKATAHMHIIDPTRSFSIETYGAKLGPDGDIATVRAFKVDLRGSGMHLSDGSKYPGARAMDASAVGGLIRAWELKAHKISHVMTFNLPPARLKHGPVWPSAREDYFGFKNYTGNVPIGALVGIPPEVDLQGLGLSPAGLAVARALQDYGAYCDDSTGSDDIVFIAEGAAEKLPEMADLRRDIVKIHPLLRPVLNNAAGTPGGGGAPRRPPAPPLM